MRFRAHPARERSIRAMLASIFVVPLVSLLALWGFAASVTLSNAIQEHNFSTENKLYGGAAQVLGTQLAQERLQAFIWLSSGRRAAESPMLAQFRTTDAAVKAFRNGVGASPGMIEPSSRPALAAFESALGQLRGVRAGIESGRTTALAAFQAYNSIIDAQFHLYSELIVVNNTALYQQAAASVEAGRALEMASRELTLISGALSAGGRMTKTERVLFAQTVANQRLLMADALKQLDPSLGSGYQRANASAAHRSFAAIEDNVITSIGSKGPIPVNALVFGAAAIPLFKEYQTAEVQDRMALTSQGTQLGDRLLLEVILAGGAGLVAVVLSIFLMARFGRRISRELTGLQHAALELAEDRLPQVVERLSHGEDVDIVAEAALPPAGRISETARVAAAFSSVQHTAVEAAVGQARLRMGVSQVFRNLAWRSQSLLHRQLALLDAMERRTTEPETLDELFQLDHLTTRMRRHAEGLIILSGAAPGRGWRDPVPVIDVIRGAIAEVEDYKRVGVITESDDAVVGAAVADVIHLLAELIENAASYSPISTAVTVRAERVANGFVVEVEDRGIGFSAEAMAMFNERLASPPEFDLADSDQLGLFVVARLAAKHRIRITLRSSPYGGTTAIVLMPHAIMVADAAEIGRIAAVSLATAQSGADSDLFSQESVGRLTPYVSPTECPRPAAAQWGMSGAGDAAATSVVGAAAAYGAGGDAAGMDGLAAYGAGGEAGRHDAGGNGAALGDVGLGADAASADAAGADVMDGAAASAEPPGADVIDADVVDADVLDASGRPVTAGAANEALPWLPRRVRQASLAPQLKNAPALSADDSRPGTGDGPSPAESRALVDSFRSGLERARTAAAGPDEFWALGGRPEQAPAPEDAEGM